MEKVVENQQEVKTQQNEEVARVNGASLYRTKWLMAHNRLHTAVHDPSASLPDIWRDYLKELETAETVAQSPA
ncbi:MAG: hypothetical protein ABSD88_08650 [Candidatus Korobacteraceae bacterium]|jgi:hypothetical protein